VGLKRRLRIGVDDGADVGGGVGRIAHDLGGERALQALDQGVSGVMRDIEQAQGRAALAGRTEGRQDHVVDDLFLQRRGVDEHAVEAAGLGDEGDDGTGAGGQRTVDQVRRVGAAGEGDAVDAGMADQFGADRLAASGDEGQQVRVKAGLVIEAHSLGGDQGGLFGGLGQDGIAGGEGGSDLAGEDGQGEVPGADAGEDAAAVQDQLIDLADRAL